MTIEHTEEFKRETIRIALTSGLSHERVAADMGIGKSTLGKWIAHYQMADNVGPPEWPQAKVARRNLHMIVAGLCPLAVGEGGHWIAVKLSSKVPYDRQQYRHRTVGQIRDTASAKYGWRGRAG